MKDYKRLTGKPVNGDKGYIFNCDNCPRKGASFCGTYDCLDILCDRLGELEDKIEQQEVVSLNSVAKLLNNWFDSPCGYGLNNEFVAEYMFEKYGDWCKENCDKMLEDSTGCWEMFLKAKIAELRGGK